MKQKQREIQHFFSIRNAESVDGEMYLEGISDPGAPNKRGLMLDAETSWPHIEAYVKEFEERTGGVSKGALRAMHDASREIGKIVDVDLSASPAIPVRVHVVSDEARKNVEACVLNAFSWNWAVVGSMWEDKAATKKFGRKVMRYTGRPIELSLVDAPGIPETGFTVVANFDEEDSMSEPVTAPADEPVAKPVAEPAAQPETVANGLYTAGRLGELLESLAWTQTATANERTAEGDSDDTSEALKGIVSDLAQVYAKYAAAQAAELIEGGDEDAMIEDLDDIEDSMNDDSVENGDYPGHPFRGNQHKKASKRGGSAKARAGHKASRAAAVASAYAKKGGGAGHHDTAATNHRAAAAHHAKSGNKKLADYHSQKAGSHESTATAIRARATQNSDTPEAPAVVNCDHSSFEQSLAALSARFDALEAKTIANGDHAPTAPPVAPKPAPVAVFHDQDQGGTVQNFDIPAGASILERRAILEKSK